MAKDVVLAKSRQEAEELRRAWSMPWEPYRELQRLVEEEPTFPLLRSITAYDEGADGDFVIRPDEVPDLTKEIDSLLAAGGSSRSLRELLSQLKGLALEAGKEGLTIFGLAD